MAGRTARTVEELFEALWQSRLLSPRELDDLEQRWRKEAKDAASLAEFSVWLVTCRYATNYQVGQLLRGRINHLFLGAYKLLEQIGDGRLARVFKGVDRLGQVVALKVLPPSRARDPQMLARYQREARLAARLDHPNVVRFREAAEDRGVYYLVFEHLEGETLEQILVRRGQLPVHETVDLGLQTLAGLRHLHEKGVVHRNLEPANLLVVRPAEGRPSEQPAGPLLKILDFSLAQPGPGTESDPLALPEDANEEHLSKKTALATAYAAPELAKNPAHADIRADLYSLGCILYHALAGIAPFAEKDVPSSKPVPPLNEVNPTIPKEVAKVVAILMASQPDARYPTPAEASSALEECQPSEVSVELLPWFANQPQVLETHPNPETAPVELATESAAPPKDEDFAALLEPPPKSVPPELPSFFEAAEPDLEPPQAAGTPFPGRVARRQVHPHRRLDRRDLWLMVLGAAGLLFVQTLAWLVARLLTLWLDISNEADRLRRR